MSQPLWCTRQHQAFLPPDQVSSAPTAQLYGSCGSVGPVVGGGVGGCVGGGVGGGVGGCVGGCVGKGVGGTVGGEVGKTVVGNVVVAQPRPTLSQQYICFSLDQRTSQFAKPSSQL